jgi:MFS family permease
MVLAITLILSSVATLWLLAQHEIGPALFVNLILYGSMLYARGTMTQAMVAEAAKPEELDTAFSLFFFIGFISGPFWTLLTGALIAAFRDTEWGFTPAFILVGCTYIAGTLLVAFVKPEPKDTAVAA